MEKNRSPSEKGTQNGGMTTMGMATGQEVVVVRRYPSRAAGVAEQVPGMSCAPCVATSAKRP